MPGDLTELGRVLSQSRRFAWIGCALIVAIEISLTFILIWIEPFFPLGQYPVFYIMIITVAAYLFGVGPAVIAAIAGIFLYGYVANRPHVLWPLATNTQGWVGIADYILGMLVLTTAALYARKYRTRSQRFAISLSKYELFFKRAKDPALFVRYQDGQILEANDAAIDTYGYSKEELLAMRVGDIRAPGTEPFIAPQMDEAQNQGLTFETVHRKKDGSTFPVEVSSQAALLEGATVLLSLIRDITERKQAEAARAQLASIVESSSDAIIGKSMDGTILTWNSGAEMIYGYSVEEVIGKPISILLPKGEEDDLAEIMGIISRGERIINRQSLRRTKDGRVIDVSLTFSPIRDDHGNIIGASIIARDITSVIALRKQLERQVTLLQQALVPPLPQATECCSIAAIYQAAFPGEDVGGDFYDVFFTTDGKIGAIIGDVSGKGIETASLAAAARSTIRAFTYELQNPRQALDHSNTVLISQQSESRFITALLLVLDPENGDFSYASAGHTPAALQRADGAVSFLPVHNPPLGLFKDQHYEGGEDCLNEADKLVLYTDGIFEARREKELFDLEGIERVLVEHGHKMPNELTQILFNTARDWAGGKLMDDAAILIMQRNYQTLH